MAHDCYRVASVGDAESIWDISEIHDRNLVLLDLYLDGFEGWEVLRKIKKKDPNLPVLIVTAYDSIAKDPSLAVADGYVIKNFDVLDELKQKIAEILGRKTAPHPDNKQYPIELARNAHDGMAISQNTGLW